MERTVKIIEVLGNRNFLKLWVGQIISALGDRFHQMALLGLIIERGGNVGDELAKITFWSILPFFLFSLFSGVLSDRWSRRGILIGSDIARVLLVCAIPWIIRDSTYIAPAYPVIFVIGIFTCLFSPAKYSIIPNIVEDRHLLAANSLIASSALLSVLAGTAVGCIAFDSMGFRTSMYFDAFTYLFSAVTIWRLAAKETKRPRIKGVMVVLSDIKEGMRYICQDERLIILIWFGAAFWFVGISFYIVISDFSRKIWGFTSLTPMGLFFTLLGGGLFIGSVLVGKYGDWVKRNILYTGSLWILASGIMVFSLIRSYTAASCGIFFIGVAGGAFLSPINADVQKIVPDALRGRTFACKDIFVNAAMVVPVLIIGKLTTFVDIRELMLYLGLGIFVIGIFVAWKSIKLNTIQEKAMQDSDSKTIQHRFNYLSILNDCFFLVLKAIGVILLKVLYHVKVENRERIPRKGHLIVAANHFSYMDPIVLQSMFPRRISFMMTEVYYEGRGKWLFKLLRCICVKEEGTNIAALREGIGVLKNNGVLGIFPEGGVSKEGHLQEGNPGIGFLALKSGAPVIPAFISGTYKALPKGKIIPRISRIKVIFGSPMKFEPAGDDSNKKGIVEITRQIMKQIEELSFSDK